MGAYQRGNLIGVIVLKAEYGGAVFMDWIVVKKGFRGQGVGKYLLSKAENWCLQHKCPYVYLMTESDSNVNFYTHRGFRYIGKHLNSWFGEVEHVMGKNLQSFPFPEVFSD